MCWGWSPWPPEPRTGATVLPPDDPIWASCYGHLSSYCLGQAVFRCRASPVCMLEVQICAKNLFKRLWKNIYMQCVIGIINLLYFMYIPTIPEQNMKNTNTKINLPARLISVSEIQCIDKILQLLITISLKEIQPIQTIIDYSQSLVTRHLNTYNFIISYSKSLFIVQM